MLADIHLQMVAVGEDNNGLVDVDVLEKELKVRLGDRWASMTHPASRSWTLMIMLHFIQMHYLGTLVLYFTGKWKI